MANADSLQHSGASGQGENIFQSRPASSLAAAAQDWCNEVGSYSGQNIPDGNFESYGHYTQVVWPTTTAVGMGAATAASGNYYVCGRYTPQGNFNGQPAWGPGGNAGQGGGQQHADGVYLVNSFNGGQSSSGFAYFSNIGARQQGQQPDAYIDIQTTGVVTWEGGNFQGTFQDGNVFKVSVNANAASTAAGVQVGEAANNFHSFNVFRADGSEIYSINGWNVFAVYQCL